MRHMEAHFPGQLCVNGSISAGRVFRQATGIPMDGFLLPCCIPASCFFLICVGLVCIGCIGLRQPRRPAATGQFRACRRQAVFELYIMHIHCVCVSCCPPQSIMAFEPLLVHTQLAELQKPGLHNGVCLCCPVGAWGLLQPGCTHQRLGSPCLSAATQGAVELWLVPAFCAVPQAQGVCVNATVVPLWIMPQNSSNTLTSTMEREQLALQWRLQSIFSLRKLSTW